MNKACVPKKHKHIHKDTGMAQHTTIKKVRMGNQYHGKV